VDAHKWFKGPRVNVVHKMLPKETSDDSQNGGSNDHIVTEVKNE